VRATAAQLRAELVLTARRGESLLLTIGIPVLLLVFFSTVDVLPTETVGEEPVDFLAPGVLALAVMSTAMVGLGIATGFERQYGVLKRLGSTPLGRPALLAAKTGAVLVVELVQAALLVAVALALGWSPGSDVAGAVVGVLLGTVGFAGIGLLLAGRLRGEVNLAAANGLYLVLLLLGGMVIPLAELPALVEAIARLLPAAALSEVLQGTIGSEADVPALAWGVLLVWAVAAPMAAALTFQWE
jgi:ABC-2 type transport system permease protein